MLKTVACPRIWEGRGVELLLPCFNEKDTRPSFWTQVKKFEKGSKKGLITGSFSVGINNKGPLSGDMNWSIAARKEILKFSINFDNWFSDQNINEAVA